MTAADIAAEMRTCEVGRCTNRATTLIHACGFVYACTPCTAQINRLAADQAGGGL
ncbi:hypothetical protein [Microbispora sp. KK1-11]|uniref:hypothetical protein n=1 Tax=Microbispora sp. KK1-11 TaxID=2053005 RepID=UPI00163C965C|nr:hypothetical protein [Microbispora sp. KK1-11]